MEPRSKFLSASRIKTLRQCPMKFYLSYCAPERIEMPQSWGAANGTLLHEVFEEYARGERRDWKQNLMEKFRNSLNNPEILNSVFKFSKGQKITLKETIKDNVKRKCGTCSFKKVMSDGASIFCEAVGKYTHEFTGTPRKILEDTISMAEVIFDDEFNPIDDMKVLGIEHEFEVTFENGIQTYGFIDLISEVSDNTIEIRDYKSAKRVPSDKEIEKGWVRNDIQMQLYYAVAKYCCENNIAPFKDTYTNILVTIHFLRKTPITMIYTPSDYNRILRTLRKEFDEIRKIEKPLPKGMWGRDKYWICNYCNIEECNKACIDIHGKTREQLREENE